MDKTKQWWISQPIDNRYPIRQVYAVSRDGKVVAHVNAAYPDDANELLRQIHTHDALVAALREIATVNYLNRGKSLISGAEEMQRIARAALATAEGK